MDVFSGKKQRPYELARRLEQQRAEAARLAAQDRQKSSPVFLSTLSSVIPETIVTLALLVMIFYFIMGYLQPPDVPTVDTGGQDEEEKKKKKKGGCVKNVALVGMSFTAFCFGLAKVGLGWKETIGALVTFATLSSAFLYQSQCAPTLGRCTVLWMISMAQGALFVLNAKTGVLSLQSMGAMTFTTGAAMTYYMVECSSGPENPNPEPGEPTTDGGVPEDVPLTNNAGSMDPLFTGLVSVGAGLVIATALNVMRNLFLPPVVMPQGPQMGQNEEPEGDQGQDEEEESEGGGLEERGVDTSGMERYLETWQEVQQSLAELGAAMRAGEIGSVQEMRDLFGSTLPNARTVVDRAVDNMGNEDISEPERQDQLRAAVGIETEYEESLQQAEHLRQALHRVQERARTNATTALEEMENTGPGPTLWQRIKGRLSRVIRQPRQTSSQTALNDTFEIQKRMVKYYGAVLAAFTAFLVTRGMTKEAAEEVTESFKKTNLEWLKDLENAGKTKKRWKRFLVRQGYYPFSFDEKYEQMINRIEKEIEDEKGKLKKLGLKEGVIQKILEERFKSLEMIEERRRLLDIPKEKRTKNEKQRIKEIGEQIVKDEEDRRIHFFDLLKRGEYTFMKNALGNWQTYYQKEKLTPALLFAKLNTLGDAEKERFVEILNSGNEDPENTWEQIQREALKMQPGWLTTTVGPALSHPLTHVISQLMLHVYKYKHAARNDVASVEERVDQLAQQFGGPEPQIVFTGTGRTVGHIPNILPQHGRQNPDGLPMYLTPDANGLTFPNPQRWRGG